jgi:TorA maturation chaperone TorD
MSATQEAPAALAPEDEARAAIYALIGRLFYAHPDEGVLGYIVNSKLFEDNASAHARAWSQLVDASRKAVPATLESEHTELFVGPGKAEVTPYLSHYVIQFATDNPLVELRQHLHRWAIARREGANEPEDHIAGVCEALRFAIAMQHRAEDEQKFFFETFIYPGGIKFCNAVAATPKAEFYRSAAAFTREFFELEHQAFEMVG